MAAPLSLTSFRGGFDDTTLPHLLPNDAVVAAENVEFFYSTLGERRTGCSPVSLTGSSLVGKVVHAVEWFPTNDPTAPEWFVICAVPGVSVSCARRDAAGTWHVVIPQDAILPAAPGIYHITSQAFNGKLFIAYPSTADRTHVWDGTSLRRAGLAQPVPPAVTNEGAGTFSRARFYRVRYVIEVAGTVVVRSEPSTNLLFSPSGTGAGAHIVRPTLLGEGETHWEIEASIDNVNFYRITTLAVASTTYNDESAGTNTFTALPAGLATPPGYVELSDRALILALGGTLDTGVYSNGTTFATSGWVMYTSAAAYIPVGWAGHNPPVAGDVGLASADVSATLEAAVKAYYSDSGILSEDIGTYLTQPNVKFLVVVDARLVLGGHFSDTTRMSSVYWTPVFADPGVGNDERLPLVVNNSRNLDNGAGGPVTAVGSAIDGSWYAFKTKRTYKMNATEDVTNAYKALTVSTRRGAVEGSVFAGLDQNGAACLFLCDPQVGPCVMGGYGLQRIMGLRNTWKRVNLAANVIISRGLYYPAKEQAHWWLAVDGSNSPNFKIISQVSELQPVAGGGLGRGWSVATGLITTATAVALLTELTTENGLSFLRTYPFVGLDSVNQLQRCDDSITDAGVVYVARVRSKPFFMAGLLNQWGAMCGALLAVAAAATNVSVQLIRDLGLENSTSVPVSCAPVASETHVVRSLDNLFISESASISVEFRDV
jgi:hypothetical protein